METILYFYRKRGLTEPEAEPVGLKRYLLVRVALDVGEDEWFGEKLELPENGDLNHGEGRKLFFHRRRRREHLRQQKEAQQKEAFRTEREACIFRVGDGIKKLAAEIREYAGEESTCFCVYEESIRKALKGQEADDIGIPAGGRKKQRALLPGLWQQYFAQKEFKEYSSRFWVEQLMSQAVLPYYVVLGYAPCIPELLGNHADHMKSVHWILSEADNTEELQAFVEDFYLESGLAISMRILSDAGEFRRLHLVCTFPSNILDFTAGSRIPDISGVAEGSIWLDLQSMEEKQRRVQERGAGIAYISMKEKWKYAQRRCNAPSAVE